MVKSKNIIAGLGVVAGLGMALLPLGAFAENPSTATSNVINHTIRGVVDDVISITVTADSTHARTYQIGVDGDSNPINRDFSVVSLKPGELNNSLIHTVTVSTNTRGGYDLKMYAESAKDVDLRFITAYDNTYTNKADTYNDDIKISNTKTTENIEDDDYGWGYKVAEKPATGDTEFTGNFLPIPANEANGRITGKTAADVASKSGKYTDNYEVNVGIRPAENQLAGAYEATVVYKAATIAL